MTVQELINQLDKHPENCELIIMDVTDPDPESAIQLYVREVKQGDHGEVYLILND